VVGLLEGWIFYVPLQADRFRARALEPRAIVFVPSIVLVLEIELVLDFFLSSFLPFASC
jgi:hypothetical protein